MQALGTDYSAARPGGATLHAAGVVAAGRYLADDWRGISAAEYQDLTRNRVGVWAIKEGSANGMLAGRSQGIADALAARAQRAAVGMDPTGVIYATADFDVQTSQFPVCDAYMGGFASVIGLGQTGIYGGLHYLNHCYKAGLAVRFWQGAATSWDHGESPLMPLHLHQTLLTPPVPGSDHDYILDAAFATSGTTPTNPEEDMSYSIVKDANSASLFAVNLNNGLRVGISSTYHVQLLQRLKVNNGADPMLISELDICRAYLAAIDMDWTGAPAAAPVDASAIAAEVSADVLAGLPAAITPPTAFTITGTISGEANAS